MSPSPHTDTEKRRTHTPTHRNTHTCARARTHTHTHSPPCLTARHRGCLLRAQVTADRRDRLYGSLSPTPTLPLRRAPEEVSGCRFSAGQAWCWRQLVILGACVYACVFYLPLFEGIDTQRCCLLQVCRCDLQCRRFTLTHAHTKSDLFFCTKVPPIFYTA